MFFFLNRLGLIPDNIRYLVDTYLLEIDMAKTNGRSLPFLKEDPAHIHYIIIKWTS